MTSLAQSNQPVEAEATTSCLVSADVIEVESPEITTFDTATIRLQRYTTRGGDGLILIRIEDTQGQALLSLSLFGVAGVGGSRSMPVLDVTERDEREADHAPICTSSAAAKLADTYQLPSLSDGTQRYLIIGESKESVLAAGGAFRDGWGVAYNPLCGEPQRRDDGQWIAQATRWLSCD